MNPRNLLLVLALLTLFAIGAGCLADPATGTAVPTIQAGAALIAPEVLVPYVPSAPAGWRLLAPPSPVVLEEDGAPLVSVTASYLPDSDPNGTGTRGADLVIQDTGCRPVGLRKLVDLLSNAPNDGNGPERTTLRGQSAFVFSDDLMARAYIVVADRYVVYLAVPGGTRADLDAFVTALDLDGLSSQR